MKDDKMYKIIREKAEKTLVPSGLEPAAVEKKCREIKQKRKTKKWPVVSGVAAAVLLVVCLQTWNTIRIHQVDTVPVIQEVEVIQEVTRFDRLTRTTFWIVIALLAAYLLRFFRRNIPRIIPRILSQIKSRLFS